MTEKKVNCEYFEIDNSCAAIIDNAEAKASRKLCCKNDDKMACCYLCPNQNKCEISCDYLEEDKEKTEFRHERILRCPLCKFRLRDVKISLRIGGYKGVWRALPAIGVAIDQVGELQERLLPVTVYFCPKCGRMEFFAEEKTKEELLKKFGKRFT